INICFDEPLVDEPATEWNLVQHMVERPPAQASRDGSGTVIEISAKRPLVIVSGLSRTEAALVAPLLREWKRPVVLEGVSGLRGRADFSSMEIKGGKLDGFSF